MKRALFTTAILALLLLCGCTKTKHCEMNDTWLMDHQEGVFVALEKPITWTTNNGYKVTQTASFWVGNPSQDQLELASQGGVIGQGLHGTYYIIEGSFPKNYRNTNPQYVRILLKGYYIGMTGQFMDDGFNTYKVSCIESQK